MRGHIVWFRPTDGRGLIATEAGEEVAFHVPSDDQELQGGDIVEFELDGGNSAADGIVVHLVERWVDRLNARHRALVNVFHNSIDIVGR